MPQRLLLTLLLATAICSSTVGQTAFEARRDSLFGYWAASDTAQYYNCLYRCVKQAADTLRDKNRLISLLSFIDPDPVHSNAAKDAQIREIAMRIGNKFDKKFGDYGRVRELYEISHAHVQDKILLDRWAWYVENPLGSAYTRLDDFEKALHYYSLTKAAIMQGPASLDTNALNWRSRLCANLGTLMWSRGDTLGAIREFKEGLSIADTLTQEGSRPVHANSIGLAEVYLAASKIDTAQDYLTKADSALLQLTSDSAFPDRSASNLRLRADLLTSEAVLPGSTTSASACLPVYRSAISYRSAYYKGQPRREIAKDYVAYAKAAIAADSMDLAVEVLDLALENLGITVHGGNAFPDRNELYQENTFIELFDTWSRWCDRLYQQTRDIAYLSRSAEALALARQANEFILLTVSRDPSKLIAIRNNRDLVARELDRTYKLYEATGSPQLLTRARHLFSRSKALLLEEKMKESSVIAELPDAERARLREWQRKLQDNKAAADDETGDLDSVRRERFFIENEIRQLLAPAIQRVEADTISGDYVEYAVLPDSILAMASIGGETILRMLGARTDFILLHNRFNEYISSQGASLDTLVSRELYDFLIRPLTSRAPDHLTVIPDAEIGYIPFDLLVSDDGKPLIERCLLSTAYAYASPAPAARRDEPQAEVICLAPTYPESPYTLAATRGTFYHLPFSRMEADSIGGLYGARAIQSTAATDEAVLDQMGKARIFHYAGHAVADGPDAFIALSSENAGPYRLTAEELAQAGLGPDVAILSACETGLGQLAPGEGIMSLGRSFLASGARATVMTLWTVHDGMTARIMIDFHKHLRRGLPIDAALRNAKLDYLATAEHEARHPYFWAGIVAAGDMDVLRR